MKKIYHSLYIVIILLTFSGCEDFLEENPKSFAAASVFFKSKAGIEQALMGIYAAQYDLLSGRYYFMLFGITSDEIHLRTTNASRVELEQFTFTSENGNIARIRMYSCYAISRANLLIEYLPEDFNDEEYINRVRAEGKFLRAWHYFLQVRAFGPVPLITEYDNAELLPANSTVPEIYEQIIEDLEYAEHNLPHWKSIPSSEKGRASRGAAKAALAWVYLTRATSEEAAQNDDYAKAAAKAKEVIDNEGYGLWDFYFDAFHSDHENGKEDLFSCQCEATYAPSGSYHRDLAPNPDLYGAKQWSQFYLSLDLYNKYEVGDERLERIFKGAYYVNEDTTKIYYTKDNHAYTQKYLDPNNIFGGSDIGTNFPLIRYSNVLLMYAEAENETNGPTSTAYEALNEVRERSNVTPLSGLSREEFRQAVRDERYKELLAEGIRWYDLVRWGILAERVNAVKGITVMPRHQHFPLPQSEIDANPNLVQNPGY